MSGIQTWRILRMSTFLLRPWFLSSRRETPNHPKIVSNSDQQLLRHRIDCGSALTRHVYYVVVREVVRELLCQFCYDRDSVTTVSILTSYLRFRYINCFKCMFVRKGVRFQTKSCAKFQVSKRCFVEVHEHDKALTYSWIRQSITDEQWHTGF